MISASQLKHIVTQLPIERTALLAEAANGGIKFSNLSKFKFFLEQAAQIEIFHDQIQFLIGSSLFSTAADAVFVLSAEAIRINAVAENIHEASKILRQLLDQLVPQEPLECVYIKFPNADDVSVITGELQSIERALMQIIANPAIDGSFKVLRWESGSLLISVFVKTIEAVFVIGAAAWSAAVIAKKWMEFKIFLEHAKGLSIKNDSLEDLREGQRKMIEQVIDAEALNITEKYLYPEGNGEVVERVKYAIKTISELIQKGGGSFSGTECS